MSTGRVSGKVALVTGAAGGLGAAHVRALAREGARVIATDIIATNTLPAELGDAVRAVAHDVTKTSDWARVIEDAENIFGPVSVLINNAGILRLGAAEDMTEEDYRRVFEVNQLGVFLGMQAILPSMRKAGGGSIINISSVAGLCGYSHHIAYTATKFAVRGMTKVAAIEWGKYNVRVNSIHPGAIETPMTAGARQPKSQAIPRLGQPSEIANLALFLASDESSYSTGSEFTADGGMLATAGEVVIDDRF